MNPMMRALLCLANTVARLKLFAVEIGYSNAQQLAAEAEVERDRALGMLAKSRADLDAARARVMQSALAVVRFDRRKVFGA